MSKRLLLRGSTLIALFSFTNCSDGSDSSTAAAPIESVAAPEMMVPEAMVAPEMELPEAIPEMELPEAPPAGEEPGEEAAGQGGSGGMEVATGGAGGEAVASPGSGIQSPNGEVVPTLLATRGELMLEDDCTVDRKRGLGIWSLTEPGICKIEHDVNRKPLHVPTAAFQVPSYQNAVIQITFRWGEPMGDAYKDQFLAIVPDQKPGKGHKLEAWTNAGARYTKSGLTIKSSQPGAGMIAEHLYDGFAENTWHTAVLEIVGDEALYRVDDQVAYGQKPFVAGPKNKVTLFIGTSVVEFKGIRAWKATANPEWEALKASVVN